MDIQTVSCPLCGRNGVITLIEDRDLAGHSEGHSITFDCKTGHRPLDEPEKLRLWARERTRGTGTPAV